MLLGVTGTDGAGKGAVVTYLTTKYGFTHYSVRSVILEHIPADLEPTRNQMRLTANELRAKLGDDFLVQVAITKMREAGEEKAVLESIRTTAEADTLKAAGGILLAIDADQQLRFLRVQGRRSATDKVTFETFAAQEELEKNDPDPHGMQKAKVMEMADHTIMNNGSIADFNRAIDVFLSKFNYAN